MSDLVQKRRPYRSIAFEHFFLLSVYLYLYLNQPYTMAEEKATNPEEEFINPIRPEDVAENPHLLPYAHNRGSVQVKPEDKGRIKGRAVSSMYQQTDMQLDQIKKQMELLAQQARHIQDRVEISEYIYHAEMNFEPLISKIYHLYERKNGKHSLSMVGPEEWGPNPPLKFIATVKLLADHTWDIIEKSEDF